jgi:hypothetical protein
MADQPNRSQRRPRISIPNFSLRDKLLLFAALLVLVPGLALILIA